MIEIFRNENTRIREYSLAVNQQVPFHYHTQVTDMMVCIDGEIIIRTNDLEKKLTKGQYYIILPNIKHSVMTAPDISAKYLLIQYGGLYDFIPDTH